MDRTKKYVHILEHDINQWARDGDEPINLESVLVQRAEKKINLIDQIESQFEGQFSLKNKMEPTNNEILAKNYGINIDPLKIQPSNNFDVIQFCEKDLAFSTFK